MGINLNEKHLRDTLAPIVRRAENQLAFNILEIGAAPLEGSPEPFHELLQLFPGSRINAFEVDPGQCRILNEKAANGLVYHPVALGRKEEERPFYMTQHPVCASLYKPNDSLTGRYNNMEIAALKTTGTIRTVSLDYFSTKNNVGPVDFIKIDIQGAELDVFEGGVSTLKNVTAIVSEVEFVHQYENQPLFGDVCSFLARQGLTFHKFLRIGGRTLKPIILNNDRNFATQHIWADAVFLRNPMNLEAVSSDQLLKLSILAFIYGSLDVTINCLAEYDKRRGTKITQEMLSGVSTPQ
jgi:FkbM family methyltransferase